MSWSSFWLFYESALAMELFWTGKCINSYFMLCYWNCICFNGSM